MRTYRHIRKNNEGHNNKIRSKAEVETWVSSAPHLQLDRKTQEPHSVVSVVFPGLSILVLFFFVEQLYCYLQEISLTVKTDALFPKSSYWLLTLLSMLLTLIGLELLQNTRDKRLKCTF